jgi:hypothetical protein
VGGRQGLSQCQQMRLDGEPNPKLGNACEIGSLLDRTMFDPWMPPTLLCLLAWTPRTSHQPWESVRPSCKTAGARLEARALA